MKDKSTESSRWLDEFLDKALESKASGLEFEFDSSGHLEAYVMGGITGLGTVVSDRKLAWQIVLDLRARAKLRSGKGSFRRVVDGKEFTIKVRTRDHFGEDAYELSIERAKG